MKRSMREPRDKITLYKKLSSYSKMENFLETLFYLVYNTLGHFSFNKCYEAL